MKQLKLVIGIMFLSLCDMEVNAQNYRWTTGGSNNTASVTPKRSTMDSSGNSIIVGQYQTAVDMNFADGAADTFFLYPKPVGGVGRCVFFAKYKEDGSFAWARRLYNPRNNSHMDVTDVAADDSGNVYIAGSYTGWCDFDPSDAPGDTAVRYSTQNGSSYFQSMYVAKYDTAGNFVWVMNFNGGVAALYDLRIKRNRLYITGETRTTTYIKKDTDFDPSELPADTLFFNGSAANNPFFASYNLNGDLKTARRLDNSSSFRGMGIDADNAGNIYMTGNLMGTHDLDPSNLAADTANITGNYGSFLAKYDSAGHYQWARRVLENSNYSATLQSNWLCIMPDDAIHTAGYFVGAADFHPGTATADTMLLNAGSGVSSYISRYDVNGSFQNACSIGDTSASRGTYIFALGYDDSSNLYIAGEFTGKVDFDVETGVADTLSWSNVGSNANPDIFFAKYRNDTLVWSRKIGNSSAQSLAGMGVNNEHLTIFGGFAGDVVFDPMPPVNMASQLLGDGKYLASYRIYPPSNAKTLLTYSFSAPQAIGIITPGDSVLVTVPYGTNVVGLVANFTVSQRAIADIGNVLQVSGVTANDFTGVVTYTIMAEDSTTRDYYVKVTVAEDPTWVSEIDRENESFKVWPNPAHDILHFERAVDVRLYDITGKLMMSESNVRDMAVSGLAPGIYILENGQGQRRKINIH